MSITSARPPTSGHASMRSTSGPKRSAPDSSRPGLRRDARRGLHDEAHGQTAAGLDRVAHAVDTGDVGELVRVDEHRGGAARAHRLGVGARREHRRLEVHVQVDEARGDEAPGAVERVERIGAGAGLVHAGDQRTDDADVGGAQLAAPDVDQRAAGEEQVERLRALRGGDGAVAQRGIDGIDRHHMLLLVAARAHEVGEDAPQLDPGAVGAHVDLGGDVERELPVDVLLLEQRGPRRGSSARTPPASASWSASSRSLRCSTV